MSGLIGLVHAIASVAPYTAFAEPIGPELIADAADELDRWVPSLSLGMGLLIQESTGGFLTSAVLGPTTQRYPAQARIRESRSGTDKNFSPIASVSIEFMTAGLRSIPFFPDIKVPGSPRLFAHADVMPTFPPSYRTAKNGDIDDFALGFPSETSGNPEEVIFGQGGILKNRVQDWQFSGGAGIAITADFWDRRLRIKPSFEFLTQEVKVWGEIRRAVALVAQPFGYDDMRFIILNGKRTKRYYATGFGLEFELDSRRGGPTLLSVFASARGYRFIGDLKINMSDSNSYDESVIFRYKQDRYAYRAAMGIRVRFAPE